ncbi:3-isopropylmalate dehydratase small subunit [Candidatus Saganbacteria bacterium]|nr:3-isopropylmalate dehydratase small subunit [Candidatus Saganbacteria bacterium]
MKGSAWKFGNNIDTDMIIPARYLNTSDPAELAKHCMEDADPTFVNKVKLGDFIVGGENFGCGSSREHAPIAIKAVGVSAVIAKSFARIFYRNAINIGLPILESVEAAEQIKEGDEIEVELSTGTIKNLSSGKYYKAQPFPEFMQKIIDKGGLINYLRSKAKN